VGGELGHGRTTCRHKKRRQRCQVEGSWGFETRGGKSNNRGRIGKGKKKGEMEGTDYGEVVLGLTKTKGVKKKRCPSELECPKS